MLDFSSCIIHLRRGKTDIGIKAITFLDEQAKRDISRECIRDRVLASSLKSRAFALASECAGQPLCSFDESLERGAVWW